MMRKLDQRGVAALEFCLVALPLFTLMFAIFEFGRYAITMQSLRMLANAGAREIMISYDPANNTYTGCTGDLLPSVAAKNAVPPFLYSGGLKPTLNWLREPQHLLLRHLTRFHHVDADMGAAFNRAERVHLNSLLWCVSVSLTPRRNCPCSVELLKSGRCRE